MFNDKRFEDLETRMTELERHTAVYTNAGVLTIAEVLSILMDYFGLTIETRIHQPFHQYKVTKVSEGEKHV